MENLFIIEEKIDVLEKYVDSIITIKAQNISPSQREYLSRALTDALVRNHEGIESSLSYFDSDPASDASVRWISKDGTHAISLTNSLKDIIDEFINCWPSLLYSLLTKEYWVILSTLFQSVVGVYRRNNQKLKKPQSYVLLLCYSLMAENNMKIFTIKDIIEKNEKKQPTEYLHLSEADVKNVIDTFILVGLLDNVGNAYRIAY